MISNLIEEDLTRRQVLEEKTRPRRWSRSQGTSCPHSPISVALTSCIKCATEVETSSTPTRRSSYCPVRAVLLAVQTWNWRTCVMTHNDDSLRVHELPCNSLYPSLKCPYCPAIGNSPSIPHRDDERRRTDFVYRETWGLFA